ncbi:unnamed protein product [Adineta ricciae]|uniref:Nuclear receptor domain-containing protein n=1 Tax=Adineta ricciae TaxID=249248 RepID=A0A814NHV6_ADIRI|nr:unnamed protein product [Adineta ricciae]
MVSLSDKCRVCGKDARYIYFGVRSCSSCKMFFKRNAERGRDALKCQFDNQCETNPNKRFECSYCRLMKCFQSGMLVELIRSSHPKKSNKRKSSPNDIKQKKSSALIQSNKCQQPYTLNLVQADLSNLTNREWNLLSNVSHCYNEHSGLTKGKHYMTEQESLPLKLRFKTGPMLAFINSVLEGAELLYKNNQDFLSLSLEDRSSLLHSTTPYTASVSSNFIMYKIGLMNCAAYYNSLETITHSSLIPTAKRIATRLDFDVVVMKLMLAILSFSTVHYTVYTQARIENISDVKQLLNIQNIYIELTWKYLIYKYSYEQAVRCFSDMIRCVFAVNQAMVEIERIQWFTNMIDSFVQRTEDILTISD